MAKGMTKGALGKGVYRGDKAEVMTGVKSWMISKLRSNFFLFGGMILRNRLCHTSFFYRFAKDNMGF
jgi:hypothetical protein